MLNKNLLHNWQNIKFTLLKGETELALTELALVVKNPVAKAGDIRDTGSIPGLGRSPGWGHGNPLQYSCLENPMDRGAQQDIVHGVTKSQTWLKQLSMQSVKLNWLWYILQVVQPSPLPSFITQSRVPSALTPHCLPPAINNLPSYPCNCSGHFVPIEPTHNVISGNWLLSPVVMFSKLTHTVALISPLFLFQFSSVA